MRKQLSIVLVEGDHVPRELSGLLVGMGVWVKSTWSSGLAAALEQTTPHLVVCGDPSQLPLLKRAISETHPGTPLLLIGDWDLTRAGRAVAGGLVEDLIPDSLPAADIARRLESLAARRATRMPSRSTLTPPTRAGIHPLLPVGAGRDERTPESRQDHPVPSRRPPPLPVRVMSHMPAGERAAGGSSLPPASEQAHAMPPIPRHSALPADPFASTQPTRSAPPPGPFRSTVPGYPAPPASASMGLGGRVPSSPPPTARPQSVPPQSYGSPTSSQTWPQLSRVSPSSPPPQLSRPPQSSPPPQLSRPPQSSPPPPHPRQSQAPGSIAQTLPVRSFQPAPTHAVGATQPSYASAIPQAPRQQVAQQQVTARPQQGQAPRSYPPQAYAPQSYPPQYSARPQAPASYPPPSYRPQSYPPQSYQPQSQPPQSQGPLSYPYALSPDSAPPIQMVTRTTTMARARKRRSGPGFTLGAALGVAASAAAFVGVIEFERDLRTLTSQSVTGVSSLLGTEQPAWLAAVVRRVSPASTPSTAPGQVVAASSLAPAQTGQAPGSTAMPGNAPAEGATGVAVPLELSDLGAIETDSSLGMSLAEASALFRVEDQRLPGCEQLLAGWEPPLPMIEEDRPKHGAIHRRQAQEHLVAGEHQKALQDLCKSARIDPAGSGTETLASVYLSQRSLEQAETWIRRFLADHPRSDSGRELLGDIESQQGKVAEAKAAWLDVLGVDADATGLQREVAKHWVQDAMAAFGARDLAQAERKLRRALTLDPANAGAAVLLARVLERQGDTAASTVWAKRARDL